MSSMFSKECVHSDSVTHYQLIVTFMRFILN